VLQVAELGIIGVMAITAALGGGLAMASTGAGGARKQRLGPGAGSLRECRGDRCARRPASDGPHVSGSASR
jgi:hypothetical protein